MKRILITVQGGVADVVQSTIPEGYQAEIIDFDDLEENFDATVRYLSDEAKEYIKVNR